MAWGRYGDTAGTYPAVMEIGLLEDSDERSTNEVAGFVWRISAASALQFTDYVVDMATVRTFGGSRTELLVDQAVRVGLLERVTTLKGYPAVKIIQDPDFIHLILKEDRNWRRTRDRDLKDLWLKANVILRDGDHCRWCGKPVVWEGKPGNNFGELDHLVPGQGGTVDSMVVSCRTCNRTRQDRVEEWAKDHPLLSPPRHPKYGSYSTKLICSQIVDGKSRLEDAAASSSKFDGVPERPATVDPGRLRTPVPEGPVANESPAPSNRRSTDASVDPVPVDPGISDQGASAGSAETVDPGVSGRLEFPSNLSDPNQVFVDIPTPKPPGICAPEKPVFPGRDGTGSGGPGSGTGRDGNGREAYPPVSKRSRRRRR